MRYLLRHGTVIDTDPTPTAAPATDVLIDSGEIVAVGRDLPADGAEVIDATDRFVLPGFVDTHRHVWEAVLRGTATEIDLARYLQVILRGSAGRLRPADAYAANLAGALECLDAGITTVQDYSHVQYTPEHTDATVAGLRDAGIRAVFGYAYPVYEPAARVPARVRRARADLFGDDKGLLTMAFAALGPSYAPIEHVVEDWRLAAELDVPVVVHVGSGPVAERPIETLHRHGLLRPDTLYVHGNSLADEELALIAGSGASVSITPAVEAQMGHGAPMVGRLRRAGVRTVLGVDVVTSVAGDMFSVMRATRISGQVADGAGPSCADLLRAATIDGAAALGLADRVGSLRPGKQADVVLLRADDLNLLTGEHDPIATVVSAAHPGNVDTVLVAGRIVKRSGRLLRADLPAVRAAARAAARQAA
jgi:cytosine/adenosine deaminase-related metal-dependent hydrolase